KAKAANVGLRSLEFFDDRVAHAGTVDHGWGIADDSHNALLCLQPVSLPAFQTAHVATGIEATHHRPVARFGQVDAERHRRVAGKVVAHAGADGVDAEGIDAIVASFSQVKLAKNGSGESLACVFDFVG